MPHLAPDRLFLDFQAAVAGRYSLERELGRGGMGVVYLAREVRLDRSVAIKLLPPEFAAYPALRDRFLREARRRSRSPSGRRGHADPARGGMGARLRARARSGPPRRQAGKYSARAG